MGTPSVSFTLQCSKEQQGCVCMNACVYGVCACLCMYVCACACVCKLWKLTAEKKEAHACFLFQAPAMTVTVTQSLSAESRACPLLSGIHIRQERQSKQQQRQMTKHTSFHGRKSKITKNNYRKETTKTLKGMDRVLSK